MAYRIGWVIPNRVYMIEAIGDVSLEEIREASEIAIDLVRNGQAPVHCVGDSRQMKRFPTSLRDMQKSLDIMKEPNLGWFFVLSNNSVINFGSKILSQLSKVKYVSSKNPDEILEKLGQIDSTLPELPNELVMTDVVFATKTI